MAQTAIKVFETYGLTPPAIIGVFHSSSKVDPHGRFKDLTPQNPFMEVVPAPKDAPFPVTQLRGNEYQSLIAEEIVPVISKALEIEIPFENRAMIGSSMGGLATLNALTLRKDLFKTALAFSPHWVIGGTLLVDEIVREIPKPGNHKIWMSRGDKKLDATYKQDQDYADSIMRILGWGKAFKTSVYKGAGHNEGAWAKQLADALHFWIAD
jgi:predicted alpha/beta superfamily hydrolase